MVDSVGLSVFTAFKVDNVRGVQGYTSSGKMEFLELQE